MATGARQVTGTSQRQTVGSSEDCGKLESTCCMYTFPAFRKRTHCSSQMKHSCEPALAHGTQACKPRLPSGPRQRPLRVLGAGQSQASGSAAAWSRRRALPEGPPRPPTPFSPGGLSPDATVNWLLFILHAFTSRVPRKYILKCRRSTCL